jgi:predicted hydrocarbon binding protein
LTQDQFFDFEKGGVIRTKAGSSRVFFFSTRGWNVIEKQLFSVFSTGANVMLSEMGVGYGRGVAKEVMAYTKEPYLVLRTLEELSMAAGWGPVEVKGDVEKGEGLLVHNSRCAFCAAGETGKEAKCHFFAGVCAGTAAEAFGASFQAVETRCIRKGDEACVVSLVRKAKTT